MVCSVRLKYACTVCKTIVSTGKRGLSCVCYGKDEILHDELARNSEILLEELEWEIIDIVVQPNIKLPSDKGYFTD